MNERIQEFKIECLEWNEEDQVWQVNAEKFAELIVRECVEVMRLVPYETDREFGDEVIYQDAVKKHFGVQE